MPVKSIKIICLAVCLGLGALTALAGPAGNFEYRPEYRRVSAPAKFDTVLGYWVDYYDMHMALPMYNDSLHGHVILSGGTNVPSVGSISLNCVGLTVDSVKKSGVDQLIFTQHEGWLDIDINQTVPSNFSLDIFYRGANFINGFKHFLQGGSQLHTVAYTISEPQDARYWIPCFDEPYIKARSGCQFHITVPDSFKVAANGRFIDTVRSDNLLTWTWREENRIASYLMAFAVSNYSYWADTAFTVEGDTIPLDYFVWPEDSIQAMALFDSVSVMLDCFIKLFGPYPFAKYGMVSVTPFRYGGMEHQDMTTINRSWITENSQRGVVHELAHMWWGDKVTCAFWGDIWLNEGFACYSEALYDEYKSSRKAGQYMKETFLRALNATGYPIYNPPPESLFASSMSYAKGAWVLQSLRWVMGDSLFKEMLPVYSNSFEYSNATTAEFQSVAESVYGQPLNWFFNQWVYRAGHPIYNTVNYYDTKGGVAAKVVINQTSTSGDLYKMPIALACNIGTGQDSITVVWDSLALQEFTITAGATISVIGFDPDNWILKEHREYLPELLSVASMPAPQSQTKATWRDFTADGNCAGYHLYRSGYISGPFLRVNKEIITDTVFIDTTTAESTDYYYAVTVINGTDDNYETKLSNIVSCVTSGIEGSITDGSLVSETRLWLNFPNPFNKRTNINYQLAKPGEVRLMIYNIAGQQVKKLLEQTQTAGKYNIVWDGRDDKGRSLAAGVYFCQLTVGKANYIKKMQFLR